MSPFQVLTDTGKQQPSYLRKTCHEFSSKEERHKKINYMLKKTKLCGRREFRFSSLRGPVFPPGVGWISNEVYLCDFF